MSERLFVLKGYIGGRGIKRGNEVVKGEQVQYFTQNEEALAMQVARKWMVRGWMPYLFSKTYDGEFRVHFNYRTEQPVKRKAA